MTQNIQIHHAELMNEFQIIQVMDDLKSRGIDNYTMRPGNNCIWVSYPMIDCYYIFQDGQVVDIQYDWCYNTHTHTQLEFQMKDQKVTFNTAGDGFWSSVSKSVNIVDMQLGSYITEELDFGELCVYFDSSWEVDEDGLIYTDSQFLKDLRRFLHQHGLPGDDVDYSEQGMQGDDYVSLDVGEKFLKAWSDKFGVDLAVLAGV